MATSQICNNLRLNDYAQARRAYGQALEIQQNLVLRDPTDIGFKYDLAMTYNNLGLLTEDHNQALELLARALVIRKQLVENEPTSAQYRRNLARTHQNISVFQLKLGRERDGLESIRECCRLMEEVVADQPSVTRYQGDLGQALFNLGDTLAVQGQPQEAKAVFEHSRKIYQKLVHSNPNDAGFQKGLHDAEAVLAKAEKPASELQPAVP